MHSFGLDKNQTREFMKKSLFILFLAAFHFTTFQNIYAQSVRIFGKVTESEKGEPLIGATVFVRDSNIGTATSEIGYFYLTVPSDTCVISVNFIGYETQFKKYFHSTPCAL